MEVQELFSYFIADINKYKKKNVYLFFDKDAEVQRCLIFMLDYFFQADFRICGLASKNRNHTGIRVFHKKVVHYSSLSHKKDVVIKWGTADECRELVEKPLFNDNYKLFRNKDLIVYGTGKSADDFCKISEKYNWNIDCFVDSFVNDFGGGIPSKTNFHSGQAASYIQ